MVPLAANSTDRRFQVSQHDLRTKAGSELVPTMVPTAPSDTGETTFAANLGLYRPSYTGNATSSDGQTSMVAPAERDGPTHTDRIDPY